MSRGIKPRGPSGAMIWGGILLSSAYGFFIVRLSVDCIKLFFKYYRIHEDADESNNSP